MDVTAILSRLAGVRKVAKGWQAKCPAHQDRSPSLIVSQRSNGSIGLHCFAGCQTHDVVAAIGLTMADLFADSPHEPGYVPPRRMGMTHADALRMLGTEAGILAVFTADLMEGKAVTDADLTRVGIAASKIQRAVEFVEHG